MTDQELIDGLTNNQPEAFTVLVKTYQQVVLHTCFSFVHDHQQAEDLSQEVFIEIFRSISQFNKNAKLSTWIYKIAVNKSLDSIKYKNRKRRFALKSIFGVDADADKVSAGLQPDKQLESKEKLRIIYAEIDKLPEKQKIAFNLSKIEGMSYQEIADTMNSSVSSVESLIFRAKKMLKENLTDFYKKNME